MRTGRCETSARMRRCRKLRWPVKAAARDFSADADDDLDCRHGQVQSERLRCRVLVVEKVDSLEWWPQMMES